MNDLVKLIKRELKLSFINSTNIISFLSFLSFGILIFVFALGSNIEKLSTLFVPIFWVLFLLSIILAAENFFLRDHLDGSLKELQFLGFSKESIILSKSISMWLILIIPSCIMISIFSLMFSIDLKNLPEILINFFLASPSLVMISLISVLFSLQIKTNSILKFIIIFPFYVPILIFSTNSEIFLINQNNLLDNFFILFAIFLITLALTLIFGKYILEEVNK